MATQTEPATSAIFRALRSVDVDPDLAYEAAEESRRQAGENVIAAIGAKIDSQSAQAASKRVHYGSTRVSALWKVDGSLLGAIQGAAIAAPADYVHQQGWVLTAFRNVLWQLSHAQNLEEAVVNTVMRGGDTDTNAAICGAVLGAVYGRDAIPAQWTECLLSCRPAAGQQHVSRPRPECFWPVAAPEFAEHLIS